MLEGGNSMLPGNGESVISTSQQKPSNHFVILLFLFFFFENFMYEYFTSPNPYQANGLVSYNYDCYIFM